MELDLWCQRRSFASGQPPVQLPEDINFSFTLCKVCLVLQPAIVIAFSNQKSSAISHYRCGFPLIFAFCLAVSSVEVHRLTTLRSD